MTYAFTVLGAPRTKKNSQRIARAKDGRPFIIQSKSACGWAKDAVRDLKAASHLPGLPFDAPVNLCARIYRDRAVGDLLNYLAAVSDALETAGIVTNDKWILGLNGCELLVDRQRPRVEIELTHLVP